MGHAMTLVVSEYKYLFSKCSLLMGVLCPLQIFFALAEDIKNVRETDHVS